MTDRLQKILNSRTDIDGWLIHDAHTLSHEFFFIREKMDLNRTKDVQKTSLTVYKNFSLDDKNFKGSASTVLSPAMSENELSATIDELVLGASFVKNAPYNLVAKTNNPVKQVPYNVADVDPLALATKIIKALYSQDVHDNGNINSVELFLEKTTHHIINANKLDASYYSHYGEIELVVDWQEPNGEAVELFEVLRFSDMDEEKIAAFAKDALETVRLRALATPISKIKDVPILLTRSSVPEFFNVFTQRANAQMVYQQYSDAKVGQKLQGENMTGDAVNIRLEPVIEGSPSSKYMDADGVTLSACSLYKHGELKQYHGDNRFSQYLNVPATGGVGNVSIAGGAKTAAALKTEPHLELITFSDFQMNAITGDFGGEIRLGKYFDGTKTHIVHGGSISGNFKDVSASMQFSKETAQQSNYICPLVIKLYGVSVAY